MASEIDAATHRRLLRHEAEVHALPGRTLLDVGDALFLHDPVESEPFWNRMESIRWPTDAAAFDRRLAEAGIQFASIGRQPHIWLSPPFDEPADLHARLTASGFEDMGEGQLMVASGDASASRVLADRPPRPGTSLDRIAGIGGEAALKAAEIIAGVLLAAFGVGEERRVGLVAETVGSLADPRFTHYLVRHDGDPTAVARRATFDGLSYLSSIGTLPSRRHLGLGRFVTATAVVDAFAAGSEMAHLGVFVDNVAARTLYEDLGFRISGGPGADMLLVG
jgi:ribosomal protein S18 acetylase RimI-like enzyme